MKTLPKKYWPTKLIRLVFGFAILVLMQFLAEKIIKFSGLNFPSTIFALILFALLLNFKIIPLKFVEDISKLMISILPVLFVPLLVGITVYQRIIRENFLGIIMVIVFATFITMILTAIFVDKVMEWTGKKNV